MLETLVLSSSVAKIEKELGNKLASGSSVLDSNADDCGENVLDIEANECVLDAKAFSELVGCIRSSATGPPRKETGASSRDELAAEDAVSRKSLVMKLPVV